MYKNIIFKISLGIFAFLILLLFCTKIFIEPWIAKKIEVTINKNVSEYVIGIDKVNILFLKSGLTLENLSIRSKKAQDDIPELAGEITSIRLSGINLSKIIFRKDLDISEVIIFHTCIRGRIPFNGKTRLPIIFGLNIRINRLFFNMIDITFGNKLSAKTYSVKNGIFIASDLHAAKLDTLSLRLFKQFDFEADELLSVSSDSMYAFKAKRFKYSETTRKMSADSFSIHPNYTNYAFTSRSTFQTDRIEAGFRNILVHDFSVSGYIKSNSLISSYIEIGKMNVSVFRDMRIKFLHVKKPAFQDMIYDYPGSINIDSVSILNGKVIYTEHAEKAYEPGIISFNEVSAKIFKISNDTVYKSVKGDFKLVAKALLMGKGEMTIHLKARLFDRLNSFSLNGTLSEMEASELNPALEKIAFISVKSGKIDSMIFSLTANNTKATGEMILQYHGLNITLNSEKTDETTVMKGKLGDIIANMILLDSNPLPVNELRKGIIDNKRDPERFLFNYCFKSILTGVKSSLTSQKKK